MHRDWAWLVLLMVFGLIPRLYTLGHTTVASRDCVNFIQLANNLDEPPLGVEGMPISRRQVLRNAEHPPGYPVALLATGYLTHGNLSLGADEWMRIGQFVSIAAGCWLVVPVYFLGRNAYNRGAGLLAAALATALPTLAEITADALSDSLFLAFNISALALVQRGLATNRWHWWAAAGAVAGFAYLVRPEGALIALAGGVMLTALALRNPPERRRSAYALLALSLGFATIAGPYIAAIGKLTNKPSGGKLVSELGEAIHREPPFALFVLHSDTPRVLTGLKLAVSEPLRASNYGIGMFGLIGAVVLRKNRAASILLVYAGLSLLLLGYLGTTVGYVSRRHALTVAVIACVFAAALLQWWAANMCKYERRALAVFVLILLAVSYPFDFKPLHPNREPHRLAGLWVGEHVPADRIFVDPLVWSEFIAGRSFRRFPNAFPQMAFKDDVIYVLIEPNNPDPGSKLTNLEFAQDFASKGEVVFQWPPDLRAKNAVAIYKAPLNKQP